MVGLTDSAITKFKEFISKQNGGGNAGVRIFIVPGG